MSRGEYILFGSLVMVAALAFLLERADITTVRTVAIGVVILLNVAFVYGGIRRIRKKNAEAKALREAIAEAEAEAQRLAALESPEPDGMRPV